MKWFHLCSKMTANSWLRVGHFAVGDFPDPAAREPITWTKAVTNVQQVAGILHVTAGSI